MGDRAALTTLHEPTSAFDRQWSIRVAHGRVFLLDGRGGRTSHPAPERPVPSPQAPSADIKVTTRNRCSVREVANGGARDRMILE